MLRDGWSRSVKVGAFMTQRTRLAWMLVLVFAGGFVGSGTAAAEDDEAAALVWIDQFGDNADAAGEVLADEAIASGRNEDELAALLLTQRDEAQAANDDVDPMAMRPRPGSSTAKRQARVAGRADEIVIDPITEPSSQPEDGYVSDDPDLDSRSSSSGDVGRVPMINADTKGDFFYYPSRTLGINHGHVGMYRQRDIIVEAANAELGVRKIRVAERKVPEEGTYLLWVDVPYTSAANDLLYAETAANWTGTKVGDRYRPWYIDHNKVYHGPYNCSQLVWASYDREGVDLDDNGGEYVWPANLVNDPATIAYEEV